MQGLSSIEASQKLQQFGFNEIKTTQKTSAIKMFFGEFAKLQLNNKHLFKSMILLMEHTDLMFMEIPNERIRSMEKFDKKIKPRGDERKPDEIEEVKE